MKSFYSFLLLNILCISSLDTLCQIAWKGDTLHFDWQQNKTQLNADFAGSSSIFKSIQWDSTTIVEIHVNLDFSPSTNNYVSLLLSNDSVYDPKEPNSLELKIGQSGTSDAWDLYSDQVPHIIDDTRNFGKGGSAIIQLTQKNDSIYFWIEEDNLPNRYIGSIPWTKAFSYFHIFTQYTSSNRDKFSFSFCHIGKPVIDSMPPVLTGIKYPSLGKTYLIFSEPVFNKTQNIFPVPNLIQIDKNVLEIHYPPISEDRIIRIMDSICDQNSNCKLLDTTLSINYIQPFDLLITEVYPNPNNSLGNYNSEFVEIQNVSGDNIIIKNLELLINNKVEYIKDTVLRNNEFLLIYPNASIINSGCKIQLQSNNKIIHSMEFNTATYEDEFKSNGGWSLELQNTNYGCAKFNWKASLSSLGATPKSINSTIELPIKEQEFTIENALPTSDTTVILRFSHPINENSILTLPFQSNSLQILSYEINQNVIHIKTSPMDSNLTYTLTLIEKIQCCIGQIDQGTTIKFGLPKIPKEQEVIINEILFNPDQNGSDYIEIINNSNHYFDINKMQFCSKNANGVLSDFHSLSETSQLIGTNDIICLSSNPNWVQDLFYSSGKVVQSTLPQCNNEEDNIYLLNQLGHIIDSLHYSEKWHYSELSSTENISLSKINPLGLNIKDNWFSSASSNNYGTPGLINDYQRQESSLTLPYDVVTPNNDGYQDILTLNLNFDEPGWTGYIDIFNQQGITIHTLVENQLFSSKPIHWNMTKTNGELLERGIYALIYKGVHIESGKTRTEKMTFYVNR